MTKSIRNRNYPMSYYRPQESVPAAAGLLHPFDLLPGAFPAKVDEAVGDAVVGQRAFEGDSSSLLRARADENERSLDLEMLQLGSQLSQSARPLYVPQGCDHRLYRHATLHPPDTDREALGPPAALPRAR